MKSLAPQPQAELEVVSGPDAGRRFAITKEVMGLGRENQDILLNDQGISRKHASLAYRTANIC